jgi:succinylarginine dihydrolase
MKSSSNVEEINFDGMIGPTHHYGGYAYGNLASMRHASQISHPRAAALQGLNKMKMLADLGLGLAVLPPRMRPSLKTLRELGFKGSDKEIFLKAAHKSPHLVCNLSSSASMWAANLGTISPSTDTEDGRVHITIANLHNQFHRFIEAHESFRLLNILFPNQNLFAIHPPLPQGGNFGDEGAANHTRFCINYSDPGAHLFVYGRSAFTTTSQGFPFRQCLEASEAVARMHGLDEKKTLFVQQNPLVIEKGVFHNDVISVGNRTRFLYHEHAFVNTSQVIQALSDICPLQPICVTEKMFSVEDVVTSYLFNSQIVSLPTGEDLLIAPRECEQLNLEWLPIRVLFVDVRESMRNGGGPACLRFRCVLNAQQKAQVHPHIFLNDILYKHLVDWIEKYYRESLITEDLLDPALFEENREALNALTQILHLGSFYEFQNP